MSFHHLDDGSPNTHRKKHGPVKNQHRDNANIDTGQCQLDINEPAVPVN